VTVRWRGAAVRGVEAPIAVEPGEQPLQDPPDAVRQEVPIPRATGRDRGVDVILKRRASAILDTDFSTRLLPALTTLGR
jgi:hypothetical protein